jgi:hypothetical protein
MRGNEKRNGFSRLACLLFPLLVLPGLGVGQAETGNLFARAKDDAGRPLPGVTVTLTGVGAPVGRPTNVNGEARFVHLPPARYTLEFNLQGFQKVIRKDITVAVNENTQVNVTMKLAAMKANLVVTGGSPLLDSRTTGASSVFSRVELERIPTARDPWAILQSAQGVQIDRVNVGGSESGQQSIYVGKASGSYQNTWNIDGVNITDMRFLGYSSSHYDFDAFAEMSVTTGGSDASIQTPGVQLNMVTKRGTNDVHGSARVIGTSNKLQSTNISPELAAQLERTGQAAISNQIRSIQDYGAEVGGPVLKDKLWLWGSYARNQINNITTGGYPDNILLEDYGGKLNASFVPENAFVAGYAYADKQKVGRGAGPTRPPETAWNEAGPTKIYRLEDSHIFSSDVFATAAYSRVIGGFQLVPPGTGQSFVDDNGIWHNSFLNYTTYRPQTQVTATPSLFLRTGSVGHEIKLGFVYRSTPIGSTTSWPQGIIGYSAPYGFSDGVHGDASFLRDAVRQTEQNYYSGYLQDTITSGNLTVNVGVRYDYQQSKNSPLTVPCCNYDAAAWPEIPFTPLSVQGTPSLILRDISPRVGLTYALGDQGKTLVKASFGRFVNQLGGGVSSWDSNAPDGYSALYYNWNDANGNGIVDPGEVDFVGGIVGSYYVDPAHPNTSEAINKTNYKMKSPAANEFMLGVEHELMPAFVVGVNGTFRHYGNFLYYPYVSSVDGRILTPDDYDCAVEGPYPVPSPSGTPHSVNVCNLKPGRFAVSSYQTNRPGYYQNYWGIDFNATKRYSDKWMARFNFQWMSWKQYGLAEGQSNPSNINLANGIIQRAGNEVEGGNVTWSGLGISGGKNYVYINAPIQMTLSGMYSFPLDFNLSTSMYLRQGYPTPYYRRASTGSVVVGRVLNPDGTTTDITSVYQYTLGDVGDYRLNWVYEWDLGISKVVTVGPLNVTLMADIFNILNRNTVMQRTTRVYDAAGATAATNVNDNNIYEQQSPRIWRFGVRLSF